MKKHIIILCNLFGFYGFSQEKLKGKVYENTQDNKNVQLIGATVAWEGTTEGTQTDTDGKFELPYKKEYKNLVVSFVGMRTDTIVITENTFQEIILYPDTMLETLVIERKRQ